MAETAALLDGGTSAAGTSPDALKIFISYSRRDLAAADAMVAALEGHGFAVTIDRRDLPYGEEWQTELAGFIAASDTVVWLVSPDSVKSKWVNWELGEVGRLSKRLIPVKVRETPPEELPEALGRIHLLPAEGEYDPALHEADLVRALNTDRAWLRMHTLMAEDATAWVTSERDAAHLLRGRRLSEAEAWSIRKPASAPTPTNATMELLLASRAAQRRGQRITVAGSITAAIVAIGLAATAVWQGVQSRQREIAALDNESASLAALSRVALLERRPIDAVKLALTAWPSSRFPARNPLPVVIDALSAALPALNEIHRFDGQRAGALSSDGLLVASSDVSDNGVVIRDAATGATVGATFPHPAPVTLIRFSPDGGTLLTISEDRIGRLWKVVNAGQPALLQGHEDEITAATFSPDGSTILTASLDGTARVWNGMTGDPVGPAMDAKFSMLTAAFSPDGSKIATGASNITAQLWSTETRLPIGPPMLHEGPVSRVVFSPDGKRLATVAHQFVRFWDTATGQPISESFNYNQSVTSLSFPPSGKLVLIGLRDGSVFTIDSTTGVKIAHPLGDAIRHDGAVTAAVFTPDGRRIVSSSADGSTRISDARYGFPAGDPLWHENDIVSMQLSSAANTLVTTSDDGTVRVWNTAAPSLRWAATADRGELGKTDLSSDGLRLITLSAGKSLEKWNVTAGGGSVGEPVGDGEAVIDAAFSDDGNQISFVREDGTAAVSNAVDGTTIGATTVGSGPITFAVFAHSGDLLFSRSADGTARISRDLMTAPREVSLNISGSPIAAKFSAEGGRLAIVTKQKASVWNAESGNLVREFAMAGDFALLAVSRDGGRLAVAYDGAGIAVADVGDGSILMLESRHEDTVASLDFSPDGRTLLSAAADTMTLWDTRTGRALLTRTGAAGVRAAFSPDGMRIVTGSFWVRVWDALTLTQVSPAIRPSSAKYAFSSRDGASIVTAGENVVQIWNTPTEQGDAFRIACQRLGSNTSLEDVQERYGLGELSPICGDNPPLPVDWSRLE